jgi:hypothetical protein
MGLLVLAMEFGVGLLLPSSSLDVSLSTSRIVASPVELLL